MSVVLDWLGYEGLAGKALTIVRSG